LKGANLFYVWTGQLHRPTKDLDLLRIGESEPTKAIEIFSEIINTEVSEDGLTFDADTLTADYIRENEIYAGIRLKITAELAGAKIPIQVDVGIGDNVYPEAGDVEFPTLLEMPAPQIHAYQFETAIAEKFEAMVKLAMSNSRMKDFYDIYILARDFEFDGAVLKTSIQQTFARRQISTAETIPMAWTEEFFEDEMKTKQWRAFLRKSKLQAIPFPQVVAKIQEFLQPIWNSIRSQSEFNERWRHGQWS
jgi:hypothetical protein